MKQQQQDFGRTAIVGSGPKRGIVAKCCNCGAAETLGGNAIGLPLDVAVKRFEQKGWDMSGGKRERDTCPKCVEERDRAGKPIVLGTVHPAPQRVVEPAALVPQMPTPVVADPPEPMARDDRRIIFAKLNDVYVDERVGYSNGWSDQRVAEDLNVPRGWVKGVREENFGPEATSEELRSHIDEARRLLADATDAVAKMEKCRSDAVDAMERLRNCWEAVKSLQSGAERIEKQLSRIVAALAR